MPHPTVGFWMYNSTFFVDKKRKLYIRKGPKISLRIKFLILPKGG